MSSTARSDAECSRPGCNAAAEYVNEGGLCGAHWWRWWFEQFSDDELRLVVRDFSDEPIDEHSEGERAAVELELRRAERGRSS